MQNVYLWTPSSLVCCLQLATTYFQKWNLPRHASQSSEHQVVSIEYDALRKGGLFWTMFMACSWQDCPWRLGTWWTWVPCKYVRRELLHFGQGFVGEPEVNFPWHVPASESSAVSWHSHSTLPFEYYWMSQVNWPSIWHFFLQVSQKFSLQWLWFSFVYHILVTQGLFKQ